MSNIDDAGIVVLMIAKYNDENKKQSYYNYNNKSFPEVILKHAKC